MGKIRKRDILSTGEDIKDGTYRVHERESSLDECKKMEQSLTAVEGSINQQSSRQTNLPVWIPVIVTQVVGVAFMALLVYWIYMYKGFGWSSSAELQFNWHPLLMVLGLVFFYGNAILSYRVLHFLPKWILKLLHATLHLLAAVLSSVGLAAVFENHRRNTPAPKPDLYSLHSWLGLATYGFFCLQFVGSLVTFLYPGLPVAIRSRVMPFHTFFGIAIFLMAVCSAEMGLTEKLLFTKNYSSWSLIPQGVVGNLIGVLLIVFSILVVYIVTEAKYKRKPLPTDS